jgi:hypothetical protein
MAREAFKGLTTAKVASLGGNSNSQAGAILGLLGKITTAATSSAETRNWLSLPGQIKIKRVALDSGAHSVTLSTRHADGVVREQNHDVSIEAGKMTVWKVRSFAQDVSGNIQQSALK